ncbi:MAG: hypothetical protein M1815_001007 [Lichina confinis]|nr:MAG: hypothetical protein M1815_001007 [Lichina confinis]
MPVQHTILGQSISIPTQLPPRRILVVFGVVFVFVTFTVFSLLSTSTETLAQARESIHHLPEHISAPTLPKLSNLFKTPAHKPPVQANSTSGDAKWFSDWKWLHPFSSSVTLDENRALLPPLRKRPPIYTYYEQDSKKSDAVRAAEDDLLLIWRRAWWAQGFRPIVLGRREATNNPLYESLRDHHLQPGLESEVARFLAWEHMGAGLLANWLAVPMAAFDNPLLSYLRKGDYQALTVYDDVRNGLICGGKEAVTAGLRTALLSIDLNRTTSPFDDVSKHDAVHQDGVALYDAAILKKHYKPVLEKLQESEADGLRALGQLITSHLQITFQSVFSKGIAVLNPTNQHIASMVQPALQIAQHLAACAESPMPTSCPPNRRKCRQCVSSHQLPISTAAVYRSQSNLYTIGTVPHPYTLATLKSHGKKLDVSYIRRETERDRWILLTTKELLGTGVGNEPRLLAFKEAVASELGRARSLWLVPEKDAPTDLDWHFGFAMPKNATDKGYATPPVPGSKPYSPPDAAVGGKKKPTSSLEQDELDPEQEKVLLEQATRAVRSTAKPQVLVREMIEAWNLGDTEAWRFARAFAARSRVERLKWEEEEKKFGVGTGTGKGSGEDGGSRGRKGWSRWF